MTTTEEKFDRLFAVFEGHVRAYCARRLDSGSVDDAVNESFAVAWKKIDIVPDGDDALPWLYGVTHRVVQHAWRTDGRRARLLTRAGSMSGRPDEPLDDRLVERDDRRRVIQAADSLDADDQEILRLTLWEELPSTEAAVVLDISPEAARKRASRARQRLAAAYRQLEDAPSAWARHTDLEGKEARRE